MKNIDDETLVSFVRERALDAVPAPGLDPDAVLASSRRKRSLIRGGQTVIALVVAGAVVVGGVSLAGGWDRPAPPVDEAPAPTEPEPTEDGAVVGLAEGIRAVNRPVEATLADGSVVLDVGLGDAWGSLGDRLALTTGPAEGATPPADYDPTYDEVDVDPVFEAAVPGAEVRLWTALAEGLRFRVATLSWLPGDSPQDYPDGVYPAPTKVQEPDTGQTLILGAVPSWITDPTVTMHLGTEVRLADGSTGRSVDVPTFAAPTGDGRLLYLVAFEATAGVSDGDGYAVTITDGAGETLTAGCADGDVEACVASVADPVSEWPEMCGVLWGLSSGVPSYEGWWNGSPAWPGGEDIADPVDWPPIVREHPQTAQIETRTRTVLETVDRYACGPLVGYEIPADLELPPDAVVIVDTITGEILETMRPLPLDQ